MGSEILDATVITMENKFVNAINHFKFVNKKKPSLRKSDEGAWEIEGLMTSLSDMVINNLLELTDGIYKAKEIDFVEETQISSQIDDFINPDTEKMVIPETQVTPRINKETHTLVKLKLKVYRISKKQSLVK